MRSCQRTNAHVFARHLFLGQCGRPRPMPTMLVRCNVAGAHTPFMPLTVASAPQCAHVGFDGQTRRRPALDRTSWWGRQGSSGRPANCSGRCHPSVACAASTWKMTPFSTDGCRLRQCPESRDFIVDEHDAGQNGVGRMAALKDSRSSSPSGCTSR